MQPKNNKDDLRPGLPGRPIRAGVLIERRFLSQAQPDGLIAALRGRGHHASVIDPEALSFKAGDDSWLTGLDMVIARGRSWAVLCLLTWAEARGILTINRRAAIASVHNKAEMALSLTAAGLPVPLTIFGSLQHLAGRLRPQHYPVILKPVFGDNGNGLQVAQNQEELSQIGWPEPVALAQQFMETDGYDLKLYGIGDEVWAVRKPSVWSRCAGNRTWPASHAAMAQAKPLPLTPLWRAWARECRQLFRLDLFGIDCVQTPSGTVVIEVNDFPNYSGVPAANDRLADYVLRRAEGGSLS